jgi:hypothetical protein
MTTDNSNYTNPQVTTLAGRPFGTPPVCGHCGLAVDPDEYLALWTGTTTRADLIAVAHPDRWEDDDSITTDCSDTLRRRWQDLLAVHDAGPLHPVHEDGGIRWYLQDEAVHCGQQLEILTGGGHWQKGRFETAFTPDGPVPCLYLAIGGWDTPQAAITIPATAIFRFPPNTRSYGR